MLHTVYVYISDVDDNGAGVAAMLEVIRQITDMNKKGTKRGNTIIFASFDLEEDGKIIRNLFEIIKGIYNVPQNSDNIYS